ncbi:AmiS/UreI transporter [Arthrobacter sp. ZBG10]|uniref:AmiS/UreI family transporter n=1 Tax=unclassified Arthrobacter TaxID=235627 RepID=UPI00067FFAD1|nr:AmiS/UreI family transporter [Arthrobacter sp. ZBG10]KNH16403.1 AmiS/UreI transporter [Arthrobacter sp. ZBG10]
MAYLCLLLSGAALLANGLATLGRIPRRDAGVLSLAIGSLQLVLAVGYLAAAAAGPAGAALPAETLMTAVGMVLFGLTYVHVGIDTLLGLGSQGLGWFCGMVGFVGLLLAGSWFASNPFLAVLWLCWSLLWGLLFGSMALGWRRVDRFTGWALVLASQATATVPGFLGLAGLWPQQGEVAAAAAAGLAALLLAAFLLARRGTVPPRAAGRVAAGALPDGAR